MDKEIIIYHDIVKYCFDNNYRNHVVKNGLELLNLLGYNSDTRISRLNIDFYKKSKVYIYNIIKMISIMAFYIDEYKKTGFELSEYLILSKEYTDKKIILMNEIYYFDELNYDSMTIIRITEEPIIENPKYEDMISYYPLNPSIIQTEDGYLANIRYVNYIIENGSFIILDKDNKIRTKNYIVELDNNLIIINEYELVDKSWLSTTLKNNLPNLKYLGFEDIVLFPISKDDSIWCSCTTNITYPINIGKITLCKLELNKYNKYEITESYILKGPNGFNRVEKNWVCINSDNIHKRVKFIYSHSPLHIVVANIGKAMNNNLREENIEKIMKDNLSVDGKMNYNLREEMTEKVNIINVSDVSKIEQSYDFSRFHGSSLPLSIFGGHLSVIHETTVMRNNKRCYSHRFILYNNNWEIVKISNPWYFDHIGIEFCRSICFDINNLNILLSVGIRDNSACIYTINIKTIDDMLHFL